MENIKELEHERRALKIDFQSRRSKESSIIHSKKCCRFKFTSIHLTIDEINEKSKEEKKGAIETSKLKQDVPPVQFC